MMRLVLLLALAASQAQPVAAALLCEQHHVVQGESGHQAAGHRDAPIGTEPTAPIDHDCPPLPHDCTAMTGCTTTAPALLPVHAEMMAATAMDRVLTSYLLRVPPAVAAAPPFHPPKS